MSVDPQTVVLPKKPTTTYFLYANLVRGQVKAGLPAGSKLGDVAKAIGAQWSALTDEEKAVYTAQHDELQAAYVAALSAMGLTEKQAKVIAKAQKLAKNTLSEADLVVELPKKPLSAYFIFLGDARPALKEQLVAEGKTGKELAGPKVAAILGDRWKKMTDVEKQVFTAKREQLQVEYVEKLTALGYTEDDVKRINKIRAQTKKKAAEAKLTCMFPAARINSLLNVRTDALKLDKNAAILINKSAELFIHEFTRAFEANAVRNNRKKATVDDCSTVVARHEQFDFMDSCVRTATQAKKAKLSAKPARAKKSKVKVDARKSQSLTSMFAAQAPVPEPEQAVEPATFLPAVDADGDAIMD